MEDKIIHFEHRPSRNLYIIAFICAMMICIGIMVSIACAIYTELTAINKAQEDMLNTLMDHRIYTEKDIIEISPEIPAPSEQQRVSLGTFKISHYCSCSKCCGKTDGITYTGTKAAAGRTIGVDPDVIPLGSTVYIDGQAYIAEDIGGGIKGNQIDMFVDSHQEALKRGIYEREVYI